MLSKIMAERAKANPKIEFLWNTEVIDVLGADKVEALKLRNTVDGAESEPSGVGANTGVMTVISGRWVPPL